MNRKKETKKKKKIEKGKWEKKTDRDKKRSLLKTSDTLSASVQPK
jgi:hypothetical protein